MQRWIALVERIFRIPPEDLGSWRSCWRESSWLQSRSSADPPAASGPSSLFASPCRTWSAPGQILDAACQLLAVHYKLAWTAAHDLCALRKKQSAQHTLQGQPCEFWGERREGWVFAAKQHQHNLLAALRHVSSDACRCTSGDSATAHGQASTGA